MRFIGKDILFNTGKVAIAAIVAIIIATSLELNYAISAGTVAILSIQPTKRETIKTAVGRLLAFACALVISFLCLRLSNFAIVGFACFVIIYIFPHRVVLTTF